MASRLNRNAALPELQPVRVEDSKTQRAFDMLAVLLRGVLGALQPFVQQQPWRALPLNTQSDWARLSATITAPQYVVDPLGRVELAGAAKTVAGTATTIAVLPIGCRPQLARSFAVAVYNAGRTAGTIDIGADGRVILISPAVAASIEVYLDGVRFDTRV